MIYKSIEQFNKLNEFINDYEDNFHIYSKIFMNGTVSNFMGDLADMYYAGTFIEIKRDFDKAYEWYTKAAKLGHIHSIRTLGNAYQDGYGVHKDLTQARYWFEKGSELGDDYSKKRLEKLLNGEKNDENTNS